MTRRIFFPVFLVMALVGSITASSPASADSNNVGPFSTEAWFITQQYRDFLGREPDAAGLDFWTWKLRSGSSASDVINAMATSPEFEGRVAPVVRLYYAYFLRAPDIVGLKFWAGKLSTGSSTLAVSNEFAKSTEFQNTYGALNDAEFIELVYQNVLDRPADAVGLEFWLDQMASGTSRGAVMLGFSESVENIRDMDPIVKATMMYVGMLGRAPEPLGLDYWSGVIRDGGAYTGVIGGFLAQPEYRNRMAQLYPVKHPLTGERSESTNPNRALAVKIDNNQGAVPQRALQYADIVFEEEVEFGISRFIAMFHSEFPATIGPVRSARTTDFGILGALNLPVMAASGGNPTVLQILNDFDGVALVNRNRESTPWAYFRDNSRPAPHNLYVTSSTIMAAAPAGTAPQEIFEYREAGVPGTLGQPTNGVKVNYGRTVVEYQWNQNLRGWQRTQNGQTHKLDDGTIIAPDNVVVLEMDHRPSPADADTPEAVSTGLGVAHVYTEGKHIVGTWQRFDVSQAFTLRVGPEPILLTPGETFVQLTRPGITTQR
ncbi:MAG: DUF4214 domain-containing protein [Acidimicrobiia bacterium]